MLRLKKNATRILFLLILLMMSLFSVLIAPPQQVSAGADIPPQCFDTNGFVYASDDIIDDSSGFYIVELQDGEIIDFFAYNGLPSFNQLIYRNDLDPSWVIEVTPNLSAPDGGAYTVEKIKYLSPTSSTVVSQETITIECGFPHADVGEILEDLSNQASVSITVQINVDPPLESDLQMGPFTINLYEGNDTTTIGLTDDVFMEGFVLLAGNTQVSQTVLATGEYPLTSHFACISLLIDGAIEQECSNSFVFVQGETSSATIVIDKDSAIYDEIVAQQVVDDTEEKVLTCKSGSFNLVFKWLLCPIIDGLFHALDALYQGFVIPLLIVDPLTESTDPNSPDATVFTIWNSFRIIANILFFLVFLVAIFGQSISGFPMFSAYEMRKIIPRLVLGIIGIQLSWYLVGFAIDAFNVLGAGIRALILAPVEGINFTINLDFAAIWQEIAAAVGIIGVTVGVALVLQGGIISGIPLVLMPIVMGVLLVVFTLLARKVFIMLLIVVSPIAFVAWILPNTDMIFKKWWEYFWKLLFMYPIIVALLASGELMAKVIVGANSAAEGSQESILTGLLGIIALFAPYFLIPFTFRFAGQAVAEVANGLDRRGKGINQRIFGDKRDPRSYRAQRMQNIRSNRTRRRAQLAKWGYDEKGGKFRKAVGAAAVHGDRNLALEYGKLRKEAEKRRKRIVGSGRDEERWSVMGKYNIASGGELSSDGQQMAAQKQKMPSQVKAEEVEDTLEYGMSKINSKEGLKAIHDRFFFGAADGDVFEDENGNPIEDTNRFGGGLTQKEKEQAWSNVMERLKDDHVDGTYRNTGGDFAMQTQNTAKMTRYLKEHTSRKEKIRTRRGMRQSSFQGVGEVFDDVKAKQAHYQGVADRDGGRWTDHLSPEDRKYMETAAMYRRSMSKRSTNFGNGEANEEYRKLYDKVRMGGDYRFLNDVENRR